VPGTAITPRHRRARPARPLHRRGPRCPQRQTSASRHHPRRPVRRNRLGYRCPVQYKSDRSSAVATSWTLHGRR